MDISLLKKYTKNLCAYTAEEVDELEFMTDDELEAYQNDIEKDTGNHSDYDSIRAIITLRHRVAVLEEFVMQNMEELNEMDS